MEGLRVALGLGAGVVQQGECCGKGLERKHV